MGIGRSLLGLFTALFIHAQEPVQDLQLGAFGTLGAAGTDTNKVGFRRDSSQDFAKAIVDKPSLDLDTRLGVQLSGKLSDTLLATFQAVSRLRYDGTYKPDVTWACLAWNPVSNLQLKAGILGLETLPNGDLSDVGYSYLWVRPPVEVFGSQAFFRIKGVVVTHNRSLGPLNLELKGFAGETMDWVPNNQISPTDVAGSKTWGLIAKASAGPFRGRALYNSFKLSNNLPQEVGSLQDVMRYVGGVLQDPRLAAAAAGLDIKGTSTHNLQLGGVWEEGPYQLQGAVNQATASNYLFGKTRSGFLSFGYRVGTLVPYGMFARAQSRRVQDPDLGNLGGLPPQFGPLVAAGQVIAAKVHLLDSARDVDQHTWSAGLRWDFSSHADLKFQVDRVGAHNANGMMVDLNPGTPTGWNGRATVMSITLDFVFGSGR